MDKKEILLALPPCVRDLMKITRGWLVGKAVINITKGATPKDYDIFVPDREKFHEIIGFLKRRYDITFNNFGGLKFTMEGYEIDIWSQELSDFLMKTPYCSYVCSYKHVLKVIE